MRRSDSLHIVGYSDSDYARDDRKLRKDMNSLSQKGGYFMEKCKENGPLAHLLWILVFDDQHNQIGLMNLQVFIL